MFRKHTSVKKLALTALTLSAITRPAWAATNIDKCQTISTPGSYQLVKDITLTAAPPNPFGCIVIKTDNVTLDLGAISHHSTNGALR